MLQLTCHPPTQQQPSCKWPGAGYSGQWYLGRQLGDEGAMAWEGNSVPHSVLADAKCDELGDIIIRLDPAFAVSPAGCRHNLPNPLLGAIPWGRILLQPLVS
jgi:hypothetical protein